MSLQSNSRNRGSKGLKVKKTFQVALLIAVGLWLFYQIKHSYDKKAEYAGKGQTKYNSGNIYLGRKGSKPVSENPEETTETTNVSSNNGVYPGGDGMLEEKTSEDSSKGNRVYSNNGDSSNEDSIAKGEESNNANDGSQDPQEINDEKLIQLPSQTDVESSSDQVEDKNLEISDSNNGETESIEVVSGSNESSEKDDRKLAMRSLKGHLKCNLRVLRRMRLLQLSRRRIRMEMRY